MSIYVTWVDDNEVNIYQCFSQEEADKFITDNHLDDSDLVVTNW